MNVSRLSFPALLVAALVSSLAPATSAQLFPVAQRSLSGGSPTRPTLVDADGDGDLDVLMAWEGLSGVDDGVALLRGDGAGGFGDPEIFDTTGPQTNAFTGADVDGDGDVDAISADWSAMDITVQLNDGAGHYATSTTTSTGERVVHLTTGDVNGDGDLDVLAVTNVGGGVVQLLGDGLGGLGAPTPIAGSLDTEHAALVDLDGDGLLDLVLAQESGDAVAVLLNASGAGFSAPSLYALGDAVRFVIPGDFNEDGSADVVAVLDDEVVLLVGDGSGALVAGAPVAASSSPPSYSMPVLADIDQDGHLDLAISHGNDAVDLGLLRGDGAGGFAPYEEIVAGGLFLGFDIGDLDGDCRPDLVGISFFSGRLTIVQGVAGGLQVPTSTEAVTRGFLRLGDVDLDGDLDAVTTRPSSAANVYWGDGVGGFTPGPTLPHAGVAGDDLDVGDLDGDGDADVVVLSTTTVEVFLSDGAGGFVAGASHVPGIAPKRLKLADLDADGALDLVVALNGGPGVSVALGDGAGGFGVFTFFSSAGINRGLDVADLTGDGHLDVVAVGNGRVKLLAGDGTGSLAAPVVTVTTGADELQRLCLPDLDADGDVDVVAIDFDDNGDFFGRIVVLNNDGAGTFTEVGTYQAGLATHSIACGDLDGDGLTDVVVTNEFSDNMTVFLSDGSGDVETGRSYGLSQSAAGIALGDLNGDGSLDAAVVDYNNVLVSLNQSTNSPWSDLGCGIIGVDGWPSLIGSGSLVGGTPGALELNDAAPLAPALMFVSIGSTPVPFKGGSLLAFPFALSVPLATSAVGDLGLPFTWPAGLPSDMSVVIQIALADGAAVSGVALSNAIEGVTP